MFSSNPKKDIETYFQEGLRVSFFAATMAYFPASHAYDTLWLALPYLKNPKEKSLPWVDGNYTLGLQFTVFIVIHYNYNPF